ncbi:nucleoside hydrolase [Duganella radicis]|uniref:nucleoside hydrolase n=1 Tax=Duganella radicis TaxID=551988 RepID=UPI001BA74B1B|nr:nucleoside hydrolase [Duganella radicis]
MRRRAFLTAAVVPASVALAGPLAAIAQRASVRVIVDNDFAGDPDGLVALAHQLLSPKARTVLVTGSPLDAKLAGMAGVDAAQTAGAGCRLAQELIGRPGMTSAPPVVVGAEGFAGGESAAARSIVAEAMRDDPLPLIVTCGGPLTNVAAALRLNPAIAEKMKLVWIGGAADAGGYEYNLSTDLAAARYVLEESGVPVGRFLSRSTSGSRFPSRR